VFGATAPTANGAPPDVVAGDGAASDGVASFDDSEEERGGTSPSEDDEEQPIAEIVSHRDTRGDLGDPVNWYYTVRYAGLEVLGEEVHEELPEDEALRRCRKLVRDYRREVGRAAAAAASPAAKATSRGSARSAASGRARGSAGGRAHARPWTDEEVAQVQKLGREQRGKQLGEAGFAELAGRLGRSTGAVYTKWMKIQTPKKRRASAASGVACGEDGKARRRTTTGRRGAFDAEVDGEVGGGYGSGGSTAQRTDPVFQLMLENAALRAENMTLRDVLGLRGMGGFDAQQGRERHGRRGSYGSYGRSASRSPPRDDYGPFASQSMAGRY
jgi:hypothetical protein